MGSDSDDDPLAQMSSDGEDEEVCPLPLSAGVILTL